MHSRGPRNSYVEAIRPDPILTVSAWAERYRILSQKASAEPGKWSNERTPYLVEIMDALSNTSPIREIVFMKGAQIGATECGNNWVGYVIDHPGPMMLVQPTVDAAEKNSKLRIDPLIEECPRLRDKVKGKRSRDSGNTIKQKDFKGGALIMTGANSAVGLRSTPVRYLFLDEIDGYPGDVDGEGDPVALAVARTRTFSKKKIFKVSTPTLEGRSKISEAFKSTDRRFYWVPCPYCNEFQKLEWIQVKWPKDATGNHETHLAYYECIKCHDHIKEYHKTKMLELGQWRAENPGVHQGRKIGFHLSALYSPVGWYSWADAAGEWIEALSSQEKMRGFVNTVLGETWKDKGEAPEWKKLYTRRDLYRQNSLPEGVVFLTCGVDVQKDRLELEIVGYGRDLKSWSIDYRVIPGDTADPDPWVELDKLLGETWETENGQQLPLKLMAIDSGYNTQIVYNWCRKYSMTRVVAVKGFAEMSLLVGQPKGVDVTMRGKTYRHGLKLWPVGVNLIKSELYGFLRLDAPLPGELTPRGFCRFPQYGEEYFLQLTAEELVVKKVRGYTKYEWQKLRDRNEALDCRVYARAAASIVGIDRYKEPQWLALEKQIKVAKANKTVTDNQRAPRKNRPGSFWD